MMDSRRVPCDWYTKIVQELQKVMRHVRLVSSIAVLLKLRLGLDNKLLASRVCSLEAESVRSERTVTLAFVMLIRRLLVTTLHRVPSQRRLKYAAAVGLTLAGIAT